MIKENKQISKNIIITAIYFLVNTGINFCLSRYIINTIGIEANGFITLANSFVDYASLITIALNSIAGRFISLYANKGNWQEANEYFNSTLIADFIIGMFLLIIGAGAVIWLEKIIQIPTKMVFDVKILFLFVFINFFLSVIIINRMDLASLRRTEGIIIKTLILIGTFSILTPRLFYIGIASIGYSFYYLIFNIYYIRHFCNKIHIDTRCFSFTRFKEMVSGGVWNTISQVGFILTTGLDLLICNKCLGATAMGQMSFPKQLYNIITGFISTLTTAFQPTFVKLYAENDFIGLERRIKEAMELCGLIAAFILSDVIVYGEAFLKLYMPGQDTHLIWILMILSLQVLFVSGTQYPLYYVYTLANKLKINSWVEIFVGVLNVIIVFLMIYFTGLDIYAVAGVSTTIGIIKNLTFTPMYSAHCINLPLSTFFAPTIKYVCLLIVTVLANGLIAHFLHVDNWLMLVLAGVLSVIIDAIIGLAIFLNYETRKKILKIVSRRLLDKK